MDPATRFWQIGQRQLALQEGLDLLRQAELELLRDMAGADRWAFVALAAHACQVPLNVVVGGLQLGALRPVFDGFGHALRAAVTADAARRGQWAGAALPHAFWALQQGIGQALARKGAAYAVPGANILLGLAEDSFALLQAAQDVSRGRDEMQQLRRQLQRSIHTTLRQMTVLGVERNRALERMQLRMRAA